MDQSELEYIKDKIMYEGLKREMASILHGAQLNISHAIEMDFAYLRESLNDARENMQKAEQLYEEFLKIPPFAGREPKEE